MDDVIVESSLFKENFRIYYTDLCWPNWCQRRFCKQGLCFNLDSTCFKNQSLIINSESVKSLVAPFNLNIVYLPQYWYQNWGPLLVKCVLTAGCTPTGPAAPWSPAWASRVPSRKTRAIIHVFCPTPGTKWLLHCIFSKVSHRIEIHT